MRIPYRWACFALAALLASALLWTHRFQYEACDTDGCVAINRWSGVVTFREATEAGVDFPSGAVVRASTRPPRGRVLPVAASGRMRSGAPRR